MMSVGALMSEEFYAVAGADDGEFPDFVLKLKMWSRKHFTSCARSTKQLGNVMKKIWKL